MSGRESSGEASRSLTGRALVIAEGIETRQQLQFASAVGCDIAQGYLIGRPAPPEELLELLDTPRLVPLSIA